jgi:threonine/homoserine/homoserine lactone efflux protein
VTIGAVIAFWAVSFLLVLVPGADWAYAIVRWPLALTVLTALGAVYLLWLGITTVARPPAPSAMIVIAVLLLAERLHA